MFTTASLLLHYCLLCFTTAYSAFTTPQSPSNKIKANYYVDSIADFFDGATSSRSSSSSSTTCPAAYEDPAAVMARVKAMMSGQVALCSSSKAAVKQQ